MENLVKNRTIPIGRKIEKIRKLRGFTQDELGVGLGITKQAVSKLEQSESIENDRLTKIAEVLGVTKEGLENFNEDAVFYLTTNFNENCNVTSQVINNNVENFVNNPVEKIIELYETLLQSERDKIQILQGKVK